jgi:hypothetical protein
MKNNQAIPFIMTLTGDLNVGSATAPALHYNAETQTTDLFAVYSNDIIAQVATTTTGITSNGDSDVNGD